MRLPHLVISKSTDQKRLDWSTEQPKSSLSHLYGEGTILSAEEYSIRICVDVLVAGSNSTE